MEGVWGTPPDIISTPFLVRKGAGGWSKRVFHQPARQDRLAESILSYAEGSDFVETLDLRSELAMTMSGETEGP